jgi:hypothetical protein
MRTAMARAYATRLTVAELEAATRFYSSPAGRRFLIGSLDTIRHAEALRDFRPEPDPELIAAAVRLGMRVEMETRHLNPPPPPPPPPMSARERRRAEREARRVEQQIERELGDEAPPVEVAMPSPPSPPPPPIPPAEPARLEAARRMAEAIWPNEAFSQPLALQATVETVLALPVSAFVPVVPPGTVNPNASIGQAAQTWDPHFPERARIVSRIASEELPRLLPHAAPQFRAAIAQLYARTFTVPELDAVTGFYSTPAGRALARESFAVTFDPVFVRDMLLLMPRAAMEGMAAMVRIGQATAHLPPPPPAPPPAPAAPESDEESHDHDES